MSININIRSKNLVTLRSFLSLFESLSRNENFRLNTITRITQKKTCRKIFSILKSPHVNKTAQEQFMCSLFVKKLKTESRQLCKMLIVLKRIQSLSFPDIQLKLTFNWRRKQKKNKLTPIVGETSKELKRSLIFFHMVGKESLQITV
jgi:ribosomal protein S10